MPSQSERAPASRGGRPPESIRQSSYLRDSQRTSSQSVLSGPPAASFWFGDPDRPLFGWYHAPAAGASRPAVVLCNPIGHEALVAHRTYRSLAQHLANLGFATLRFDYDGTGDSAGSDEDPNRVEAWLSSIRKAVAEVSALSGTNKVVLIGMRVGALLAAVQAERQPVAGMVLIAPPRSGKAWMREARALQALKDSQLSPVEGVEPGKGVAGFLIDDATRDDISQLYFSKVTKAPASHALIVARDDLPGGELELTQALLDLRVDAEMCIAPGYAASMPEDPFKAVVPLKVFDAIGHWLERSFRSPVSDPASAAPGMALSERPVFERATLATPFVHERIVDVKGLFGIVAEPVTPQNAQETAVVLLNIGANHHIGSNRMYVRMSRTWATQGFTVLRMDFSGMGDSPLGDVGKENEVYASRFMAEARSAVDFLTERGAKRVVLMGLCSGAYIAYHTAIADPRVSGVVLINPLTFHWTEGDSLEVRMRKSFGSTKQYKRQLFKVTTWRRMLRGEVSVRAIGTELARRVNRRVSNEVKSVVARLTGEIAEATDIERGFRRLSARGTSSLLVLGSEDGSRDVIEDHLGKDAAALKVVTGFRLEIWAGADHTFTPLWSQQRLTKLIGEYLLAEHDRS